MQLAGLFDRNVAWAQRKTEQDPTFFRRLAEQQSPRYLWIGCSDSRVTANAILDLDPGEVFVHRNIANFVHTSDMNLLAVVEFDEGPRFTTELVNVEPDDIKVGMRVKPVFCDEGDITLLRYEPA